MGLSGCYGIIKYLVVLVNLIFWIVGLGVLVLAIWMITDPTFYVSMAQDENNYYIGIYIFLALAALMLVVAFLGCCGAFKESQCMLIAFFCCLLVIITAEIAAGAWAYYNSDRLEQLVRDSVKATVQEEYGVVATRTQTFDVIQKNLKCCGANSVHDWAGSKFNLKNSKATSLEMIVGALTPIYDIPASCCVENITQTICELSRKGGATAFINSNMYSEGCMDKLIEAIRQYMSVVVGVGIGLGIIEVLGLVFSIVLCFAIKRSDRYKA